MMIGRFEIIGNFTGTVTTNRYRAIYQNGKVHREDGPAITSKSIVIWSKWGKVHRSGGPAITYKTNQTGMTDQTAWFLEGIEYTEDDYKLQTRVQGAHGRQVMDI